MIAAGGGIPAVRTAEVDRPEPGADQIIVSVTAYSINRGRRSCWSGRPPAGVRERTSSGTSLDSAQA